MPEEKCELYEIDRVTDTETVKCASCGANMHFDPETQMLSCDHCGRKESVAKTVSARELSLFSDISKTGAEMEDSAVFSCDNCGAKVVLSGTETAAICPFCGTPHVRKAEELSGLKPNAVLPFLFDKNKAVSYSKSWAKKKIYAPRDFKKSLTTESISGIYTPCFTFDSKTSSTYYGRVGKHRTVVVGSGKNRHTQTYTVWKNISGTYFDDFNDVLISAGNKIDQKKINKLSPYETDSAREYDEKFVLGYMSYRYDREISDCWTDAKGMIDNVIRRSILSRYEYDVVDYLNVSTEHTAVTYKYVMLPVYVGNFKYNKKTYNFYVNGTTGKVYGKTPLSALKILFTVLGGLAIVATIGFLVFFL